MTILYFSFYQFYTFCEYCVMLEAKNVNIWHITVLMCILSVTIYEIIIRVRTIVPSYYRIGR